jgi:tetratricopeptide (TPR) repeat protein
MVPQEAPAMEPPPAGTAVLPSEAKAAQQRAAQVFREGKFVEAAELLLFAYGSDPRPILLFNAGQAYRKAEHPEEAKLTYERFVAAAPDHALVPETRGYIKDMETLLATQARSRQVALELEDRLEKTQTHAKQAALLLEKERLQALLAKQQLTQTQAQLLRERNRPLHRRPVFWGPMIGVASAVVVGVTLGVVLGTRGRTDGGNVIIEE